MSACSLEGQKYTHKRSVLGMYCPLPGLGWYMWHTHLARIDAGKKLVSTLACATFVQACGQRAAVASTCVAKPHVSMFMDWWKKTLSNEPLHIAMVTYWPV